MGMVRLDIFLLQIGYIIYILQVLCGDRLSIVYFNEYKILVIYKIYSYINKFNICWEYQ